PVRSRPMEQPPQPPQPTPPPDRTPGDRPPASRQLDRPPSDRYAPPPTTEAAPSGPTGSIARSAAFAATAAVIAMIVYVVFAGPLAFSAGLVIIAIFAGRVIGQTAKVGAGTALTSDQRVVIALVVTIAWFVVTQIAVWLFARSEGGVLAPVDYLLETF